MITRNLTISFARSVNPVTGYANTVECVVVPIDSSANPVSGATYITGPANQTAQLSAASTTLTFQLVPTYSSELSSPVTYRIAYRTGLIGNITTADFAMPDADVSFESLQSLGNIINDLGYLKEADLGVAGRVAALNAQGQVIDAQGNVVGAAADISAALTQEISDRQTAVTTLNTSLSNAISNAQTSAITVSETHTDQITSGIVATANTDRAIFEGDIAHLNSQMGTVNAALPLKADLINGKLPLSQAPDITIGNRVSASGQAGMLGFSSAQVAPGDICVRPDGTWMLTQEPPSVLANWTQITSAADQVLSVNGQYGIVTLTAASVGAYSNASPLPQTAVASLPSDLSTIRANIASVTATANNSAQLVSGLVPKTILPVDAVYVNGTGQIVDRNGSVLVVSGNVQSVNNKTGNVILTASDVGAIGVGSTLSQNNVTNLVSDLAAKAPLASPTFTGTVTLNSLKITGGNLVNGYVLTSNALGQASWAAQKVTSVAGRTGDIVLAESDIANLVSDLAAKATVTALNATNNQVAANTTAITALQSGSSSSGAAATLIDWQNSDTVGYALSSVNILGPFGINSSSVSYYNPAGAASGEQAWPYVTPNGHLQLRKLNPGAPADSPPATQVDITNLQGQITTLNATVGTKANQSDLNTTNSNVSTLQSTVTTLAPLTNPSFIGTVTTPMLQVTSGSPATGEVLTSDASGNATWQTLPVTSVNGKTGGAISLVESDIPNLVSDLASKAPTSNPTFTGTLVTPQIKITGSPTSGYVLTADSAGNGTWQAVGASAGVNSINGKTGTISLLAEGDIANLTSDLAAKADLVSGVLKNTQVPPLALHDVVTAASRSAMLALTTSQVQYGDMCVITGGTDQGNYILSGPSTTAADPTSFANWTQLTGVNSINGKTGVISQLAESDIANLTTDLANKVNTSTLASYSTTAVSQGWTATRGLVKYVSDSAHGNITTSGTQGIDGVTVSVGDRVLLTAQSSSINNGIWIVQSGTWTRPTDYATGSIVLPGTMLIVSSGGTYANTFWQATQAGAATVDTSATSWLKSVQAGATSPTAGNGISVSGSTISTNLAATNSTAMIGTGGLTYASGALEVDSTVARRYSGTVPSGATTATIPHNLGNQWPTVQVYDTSTGNAVLCGITGTNASTVTLTFQTAPTSGQYVVTVIG